MDGDDQLQGFADWLAGLATQAGYNPRSFGGATAFAKAAGTERTQTGKAFRGEARPQIATLRAWTKLLQSKGVEVTLRDMLIRSGTVQPQDLPAPGEVISPAVGDADLYAVARAYGIPDERAHLFVTSVRSLAQTFADDPKADSISGSQTGGQLGSAER